MSPVEEELVAALKTARDLLSKAVFDAGEMAEAAELARSAFEHIEDTLAPYIQEVTHGGGTVEGSGDGV